MSQYCNKCGDTNVDWKWCKSCLIDNLKKNFTNWTSDNKNIDDFIQEMQLKINDPWGKIFEWIPYNQFSDINKEIGRDSSATLYYSAIWKGGPLEYDIYNEEYTREPNKKVALKYLHNSQNITNEFLNSEV
jgi:hypothetical protein